MIDVVIEINGLKQLNVVEPGLIEKLKEEIGTIFSALPWESSLLHDTLIIYRFSLGKRETRTLFEAVERVWNAITSRSEKLRGFTLLVDKNSFKDEEIGEKVEELLLKVPEDETFWFSKEAISLFSPHANFEECGGGSIFVHSLDALEEHSKDLTLFMDSHPSIDAFMEQFSLLMHGEEEGLIFLNGPAGSGKRHLIRHLQRVLSARDNSPQFLIIESARGFTSPAVPLLSAINRLNWNEIAETLMGLEQISWQKRSHLLSIASEMVSREDGEILFALFIKAYADFMEKKLLPPIVIIQDLSELRPETVRIIARHIGDDVNRSRFLLILSGRSNIIPAEFASITIHQFRLQPWTPELLRKWVDDSDLDGIDMEKELYSVTLFHTLQLLREGKGLSLSFKASKKYLFTLSSLHKKILLQISITDGFFTLETLHTAFGNDLIERGDFSTILSDLIDYGFVRDEPFLRPIIPQLAEIVEKEYPEESNGWKEEYANILLDQLHSFSAPFYIPGEAFFDSAPFGLLSIEWVLGRIERLLAFEQGQLAAPWFEEATRQLAGMGNPLPWLRESLDTFYLLSAVREGRDGLASEIAGRFMERAEVSDFYVRNYQRLSLAEYLLAIHSYRKALDPAKAALLELQDPDLNRKGEIGEVGANLLLGRILLAMHRIDEAKDYFLIARESSSGSREVDRRHEIAAFMGLSYYLEGNYTAALREAEYCVDLADQRGLRRWGGYGLFLQGRVLFTLGRYEQAELCFASGLTEATIYQFEGGEELFRGWMCRSMTYQGKIASSIVRLRGSRENPEHRFFLAEALFLDENYAEALSAIEEARNLERDRLKLFTRPLPWNLETGFDTLEDLAFADPGRHGMLFQMIRAWYGLILSRNGRTEEGQQELSRLTREEKLAEQDPNSHLYLFFQTLVLPERDGSFGAHYQDEESGEGLDTLTQLSKALRFVQGIGSRIEKSADRKDFLGRNYWNAKLTARGRAAKLM